jgi:FkbM family methyltransferase
MKHQLAPNASKRGKNVSNPIMKLAALVAKLLPQPLMIIIYKIKPLAGILRYVLNRFSPKGLVLVNVAAGKLAGRRMLLDLEIEKDYWLGSYEPMLMATIADMVKPGMIAYDLGANIGYTTLMLGHAVGDEGHVYAFEALDNNAERLEKNISLNTMERHVTLQCAAVAAYTGEGMFYIGPSNGMGKLEGSAGRDKIDYHHSITVKAVALDDFVYLDGNQKPDIIKMDIEGGEVIAFQGMERILREFRPLLLLELHGFEAAKLVWNKLVDYGYEFHKMEQGYQQIKRFEELEWKSYLIAKPGNSS